MKILNQELKEHYLQTSAYTYAGPYGAYFRELPDEVNELSKLVCGQVIHRITLREGNTNANADLRYGDMERFPWYRMRCEDDVFLTAIAMTGELFRLDARGFTADRAVENKLVVSCRYVAVLMASILKAKGVPARCRAGFTPYIKKGESWDHWITQYYDEEKGRWISVDADAFFDEKELGFCPFDIPEEKFDWAAKTWLDIRRKNVDGSKFIYADGKGTNSLKAALRYLFYDFHALMNHELTFSFLPGFIENKFDTLTEDDFREFDKLAERMLAPDENREELLYLWEHEKKYRIINSPLVGDWDNAPLLEER